LLTPQELLPSDPSFPQQFAIAGGAWGWYRTHTTQAWDVTKGDPSVVVAILDTGLKTQGLADYDGQIAGTLVVQWDDPLFWAGYPNDAGYLHRLAVRRHGDGLGSRLLRWAERHAAAAGKVYLRLDCVASNESLRAYYERAAYQHVGNVTVDEYIQSRYEKRVGT